MSSTRLEFLWETDAGGVVTATKMVFEVYEKSPAFFPPDKGPCATPFSLRLPDIHYKLL